MGAEVKVEHRSGFATDDHDSHVTQRVRMRNNHPMSTGAPMEHADEQTPDSDSPWDTANGSPTKDGGACLTPMPSRLMHWWIPLAASCILLLFGLVCAVFWGGHPHWPSINAMTLCTTITGAGFTFAAWQQRSHDNAANAKQAKAAQVYNEYWRRREQIFQLLDSKNTILRLGAIELLAELADSIKGNTHLSPANRKLLQRHIIDTLCLQVRHEGLAIADEGTPDEHAEIQRAIIDVILKRINTSHESQPRADWSQETIGLTSSTILTPLSIENLKTTATLNLSGSEFLRPLTISDSIIASIVWKTAAIQDSLQTSSKTRGTELGVDAFPDRITNATFESTTFHSSTEGLSIHTPIHNDGRIQFDDCKFLIKKYGCNYSCASEHETENDSCNRQTPFHRERKTWCASTTLTIISDNNDRGPSKFAPYLELAHCRVNSLDIIVCNDASEINIESNIIGTQIFVQFFHDFTGRRDHTSANPGSPHLTIQHNTLFRKDRSAPIEIQMNTSEPNYEYLYAPTNTIVDHDDGSRRSPLVCWTNGLEPGCYYFLKESDSRPKGELHYLWKTGWEAEEDDGATDEIAEGPYSLQQDDR